MKNNKRKIKALNRSVPATHLEVRVQLGAPSVLDAMPRPQLLLHGRAVVVHVEDHGVVDLRLIARQLKTQRGGRLDQHTTVRTLRYRVAMFPLMA